MDFEIFKGHWKIYETTPPNTHNMRDNISGDDFSRFHIIEANDKWILQSKQKMEGWVPDKISLVPLCTAPEPALIGIINFTNATETHTHSLKIVRHHKDKGCIELKLEALGSHPHPGGLGGAKH